MVHFDQPQLHAGDRRRSSAGAGHRRRSISSPGVLGFWRNYVSIDIGLKALLQLRTQLYSYLQHLPLHFHDQPPQRRFHLPRSLRFPGDPDLLQSRVSIRSSARSITLIMTFIYMYKHGSRCWRLSLAADPAAALVHHLSSSPRIVRRQTTTLQQEESDVLARASEGLTSIRIVHAFGQEEFEVREFERTKPDRVTPPISTSPSPTPSPAWPFPP